MYLAKEVLGITLIELLVVITIMMTLLGLVGGTTVGSIERVKGQTELMSVHSFVRKIAVRSFSSGA